MAGHHMEQLAVEAKDVAKLGLAKLRRTLRDRLEDWLHVSRRREMMPSTRLVAVCCSSALARSEDRSVASHVRACASSNRREFSMAITAWSAKVRSNATCPSVNGTASAPYTLMVPIACPACSIGTTRWLRLPSLRATSTLATRGSSSMSATLTTARSVIARRMRPRGAIGFSSRQSRNASSVTWWPATKCTRLPSKLNTAPNIALQSLTAFLAMALNTGCVSVGDLEITRRISLAAVCCSSASASSRASFAFSAARSAASPCVAAARPADRLLALAATGSAGVSLALQRGQVLRFGGTCASHFGHCMGRPDLPSNSAHRMSFATAARSTGWDDSADPRKDAS